jgi:NADP-dependent 3-hydroxy acid dehydrogenase YdfG
MVGGTRSVPVLITGCSSGIGRAAAISLHAVGLTVYATARQVDALADQLLTSDVRRPLRLSRCQDRR